MTELQRQLGRLCFTIQAQDTSLALAQLADIRTAAEELEVENERLQRTAAIIDERDRQDAKWGPQDHTLSEWITILTEEVGELAAAALCHQFGNDDHPELDWRKEAIQVAAVALSITEQYREAANVAKEEGSDGRQ